jgi:hypothetical protein
MPTTTTNPSEQNNNNNEFAERAANSFVSNLLSPNVGFRAPFGVEPRLVRFLREEMLHQHETDYLAPISWPPQTGLHIIQEQLQNIPNLTRAIAIDLLWQLATNLPFRSDEDLRIMAMCFIIIPKRRYTKPADPVAYANTIGDGVLQNMMRLFNPEFTIHTQLLGDLVNVMGELNAERDIPLMRTRITRLEEIHVSSL